MGHLLRICVCGSMAVWRLGVRAFGRSGVRGVSGVKGVLVLVFPGGTFFAFLVRCGRLAAMGENGQINQPWLPTGQ